MANIYTTAETAKTCTPNRYALRLRGGLSKDVEESEKGEEGACEKVEKETKAGSAQL